MAPDFEAPDNLVGGGSVPPSAPSAGPREAGSEASENIPASASVPGRNLAHLQGAVELGRLQRSADFPAPENLVGPGFKTASPTIVAKREVSNPTVAVPPVEEAEAPVVAAAAPSAAPTLSRLVIPQPERGEGLYTRVTERGVTGVPSVEAYSEKAYIDQLSTELIDSYNTLVALDPFYAALAEIPEEKRGEVFEEIMNAVKAKDPQAALAILGDIYSGARPDLLTAAKAGLKEKIEKSTGVNKLFWEMQLIKVSIEGNPRQIKTDVMKQAYAKVKQIDAKKNELDPELLPAFEKEKNYLDFMTRYPVAVDLVETMDTLVDTALNPGDKDDVTDFIKQDTADIAKQLSRISDTDEEVYYSCKQVLGVLRLALLYQYPKHIEQDYKIDNPLTYYTYWLKNKKFENNSIELPPGVTETIYGPHGEMIQVQGTVKLDEIMPNQEEEVRLFEQYNDGSENIDGNSAKLDGDQMMSNNVYFLLNPWAGKSLLEASDTLFKEDMFPTIEGQLSAAEKMHLFKMNRLIAVKRYDEARDVALSILGPHINKFQEKNPLEVDGKKKSHETLVQDKKLDMREKYNSQIFAQIRVGLKDKGIKGQDDWESSGHGGEPTLEQYISEQVDSVIEQKAEAAVMRDIGEKMFDEDAQKQLPPYARQIFDRYATINGFSAFVMDAENADFAKSVAEMVVEFVALEMMTAGIGGFVVGAANGGRAVVGTSRAFGLAGKAASWTERGGVWANRAMKGLDARMAASGSRVVRGVGKGASVLGRGTAATVKWVAEGGRAGTGFGKAAERFAARRVRSLTEAATFMEMARIYEGNSIDPFNKESGFELLMTWATMDSMNLVQKFTRNSRKLAALGKKGRLGRGAVHTVDVGLSFIALKAIGSVQGDIGVALGVYSREELIANQDPEKWRENVKLGATVLAMHKFRNLHADAVTLAAKPARKPIKEYYKDAVTAFRNWRTNRSVIAEAKFRTSQSVLKTANADALARAQSGVSYLDSVPPAKWGDAKVKVGTRTVEMREIMDLRLAGGDTLRARVDTAIATHGASSPEVAKLKQVLVDAMHLSVGHEVVITPATEVLLFEIFPSRLVKGTFKDRAGNDTEMAALDRFNPKVRNALRDARRYDMFERDARLVEEVRNSLNQQPRIDVVVNSGTVHVDGKHVDVKDVLDRTFDNGVSFREALKNPTKEVEVGGKKLTQAEIKDAVT
ncbi:hypothetical protein KBD59_01560, partial [Candidatus Gracilibacteria bacterium]|nr:hypothetical protein [Candidatus Gracilibacteria bacterium]